MSKQHTPGPWTMQVDVDRQGVCVVDADYWIVARVRRILPDVSIAEAEANATLIAAAPRMYEFVSSMAEKGNAEAVILLETINAST